MRILEQILLETNPENLEKNINAIHVQLDYYAKYKMGVEGISLIPVRDLLGDKYSDEALRSNGYVLSIAQLKEDCEKFLKLSQEKPILYNSHLKRLYRSLQVLEQNYVLGNVKSATVVTEMREHFSAVMQENYSQGRENNNKMPRELCEHITKSINELIKNLNKNWYCNKLSKELKQPFTDLFVKRLLEDWQHNKLDKQIIEKLMAEKNAINSTKALINCFRNNELPDDIQAEVKSRFIKEIIAEINAEHIDAYSGLGAAITNKRSQLLKNDDFSVYSAILVDWHNDQSGDAAAQIEKYLEKVICNMQDRLDSSLSQQFSQLAVKAFLDKLQDGQYENSANLEDYSLKIVEQLTSQSDNDDYKIFRESVHDHVMKQLHDEWIDGKLSPEVIPYIQENAFDSLHEFADKIESQVWPNHSKNRIEQLEMKLNEQSQLIRKMISQVESLSAKVAQQNTASSTNDSMAERPRTNIGLFG